MSHTLHRSGSPESLENDFPVIALGARGLTREGCAPALGEITKMMAKYHVVNRRWGSNGLDIEITPDTPSVVFKDANDNGATHACFSSREELISFLKEVKEADLGPSVCVSGLFDTVFACCKEAGLKPNAVNTSLGIWGKTDLLPEQGVLDISTMCGHGMVPFALIKDCIGKIKKGVMTPRKAAEKLSSLCDCGIFNVDRAEAIFIQLTAE